MTAFIVVLFSPFLVQCTLAQCVGSRTDGVTLFPNIPAKYLELGNYGAMDYLSSPLIESIRPNILPTFPISSIPEVTCENIFNSANPYAIEALNFEVPYITNMFPPILEAPYAVNLGSSVPLLADTPVANLRLKSLEVPFSANYPNNMQYKFNPYAYPSPDASNTIAALNPFGVEVPLALETPYTTTTPLTFETPSFNNIPNYMSPVIATSLGISAAQANYPYNTPFEFNPFPYASNTIALKPFGPEVPLALETPVLVNSYATRSPLAFEAPCFNSIPNYLSPVIATPLGIPAERTISAEIPNASLIASAFSRIASFTPSINVKCLGGYGPSALAASKGSGFFVTSSSPIRPNGVSILSENVYEGSLSVTGRLPFLGTVAFGGTLPSFGSGAVNYGCGSGNVEILSENPINVPSDSYI